MGTIGLGPSEDTKVLERGKNRLLNLVKNLNQWGIVTNYEQVWANRENDVIKILDFLEKKIIQGEEKNKAANLAYSKLLRRETERNRSGDQSMHLEFNNNRPGRKDQSLENGVVDDEKSIDITMESEHPNLEYMRLKEQFDRKCEDCKRNEELLQMKDQELARKEAQINETRSRNLSAPTPDNESSFKKKLQEVTKLYDTAQWNLKTNGEKMLARESEHKQELTNQKKEMTSTFKNELAKIQAKLTQVETENKDLRDRIQHFVDNEVHTRDLSSKLQQSLRDLETANTNARNLTSERSSIQIQNSELLKKTSDLEDKMKIDQALNNKVVEDQANKIQELKSQIDEELPGLKRANDELEKKLSQAIAEGSKFERNQSEMESMLSRATENVLMNLHSQGTKINQFDQVEEAISGSLRQYREQIAFPEVSNRSEAKIEAVKISMTTETASNRKTVHVYTVHLVIKNKSGRELRDFRVQVWNFERRNKINEEKIHLLGDREYFETFMAIQGNSQRPNFHVIMTKSNIQFGNHVSLYLP